MNSKWYFSTLLLILFICFGAFQEEVATPNQQIILEFVDGTIDQNEVTKTINDVKEKLISAGVSNIIIKETKDGTLKISYFSAVAINNIKDVLAKDNTLALNQNSENKDNNLPNPNYSIDIYELTDDVDISDLNDKYVFEIKYTSDRFTTNQNIVFVKNGELKKAELDYKIAFEANKNNPFTKDRTSYKVPEVRAGPTFFNC